MAGYWEKRYLKDKAASVNTSEKYINSQLKKAYAEALKEMETELQKFYTNYASAEGITLAEAKKKLKDSEKKTVDFEKLAKEVAALRKQYQGKTIPDTVEKQLTEQENVLNRLSKRGQISRLEALNAQIEQVILKLNDKNQMSIYDLLKQQYEDGYYRSLYKAGQNIGIPVDFAMLNEDAIQKAVLVKRGVHNFSKSLYQQRKNLSMDLKENLTVGMIRGESMDAMAKRIHRRMSVNMSAAKRLVRTETAYVYEQATLDGYAEAGITQYEFLATLDNKTSLVCQELDGKRFQIEEAVPGKNYPPMHPNCRSTTVAVFDEPAGSKRLAKDENGKYYKVPSGMTYQEWKNKSRNEQFKDRLGIFTNNDKNNPKYYDFKGKICDVVEAEIANKSYEIGVIFDKNGKAKYCQIGEEDSILFTKYQLAKMKGMVVTHNHPNATSLSPEDVYLCYVNKAETVRATGEYGTYELRYSEIEGKVPAFEEFDIEYTNSMNKHQREAIELVKNGMSERKALICLGDMIWDDLYQKYGFKPTFKGR